MTFVTNRADLSEHESAIARQHVVAIARYLIRTATVLGDGSLSWGRGFDRHRRGTLDAGLFNGRCGEAVFLAAVYQLTGDAEYHAAACAALAGIRQALRSRATARELVDAVGIGISGVGGIVYALVRSARFLSDPTLLELADTLARELASRSLPSDTPCDIVTGAAGALDALVSLGHATGSIGMEAAERCADYLLSTRQPTSTGGLAWPDETGRFRTGFAHGSSGIAHALLAFGAAVGDLRCYDSISHALVFERGLYDPTARSWLEHVDQLPSQIVCRWCQGAVGIGLARAHAVRHQRALPNDDVAADLERALRAADRAQIPGPEGLCCGLAGLIDFLLEVSLQAPSRELRSAALERATLLSMMLGERLRPPALTRPTPTRSVQPLGAGLWQGWAGVGYTFLRVLAPVTFPSLLAFS